MLHAFCLPSCITLQPVPADKSKSVVRLRNVMMELRKAVNHPCLASVDLTTPAHAAAVARRQAAAAAAAKAVADGEHVLVWMAYARYVVCHMRLASHIPHAQLSVGQQRVMLCPHTRAFLQAYNSFRP
jgi:hypothetical protein